jgi:addiction module HigA family antidote
MTLGGEHTPDRPCGKPDALNALNSASHSASLRSIRWLLLMWSLHLTGDYSTPVHQYSDKPVPHRSSTSLREDVLPALGLTVTEAARQLGVSRVSLSRVLNGKAAISPDMALRLEAWLGGPQHGPSAESWLRGQMAYDIWHARKRRRPKVKPAARDAA